ncbi:hypothetical protein BX667DRAFT_506335 [Coemansia mojavensis]|nr:hypothetical protein BX667DRAFT_506335 [Coemansia mojavensis]
MPSISYASCSMLLYQTRKLALLADDLERFARSWTRSKTVDKGLLKLLNPHSVRYIPRKQACQSSSSAVELGSCVFSRGEQMLQLQPLQLTIKHGEFIAAVGRIGSGKSSLLPAICGEMPLLSGSGCVYGSIGHVGQKPWTMNATFRDSVLFGNAYDEQKYSRTIAACALKE